MTGALQRTTILWGITVMKYVDEFRDGGVAAALAERIKKTVRRPWTIMEVCGGQTHSIVKFGLDSLLPQGLTLVQRRART
nr:hypothetical protein [Nitrosomonas nitrosa]